jgi:hypothetical protein
VVVLAAAALEGVGADDVNKSFSLKRHSIELKLQQQKAV